MVSFQITKQLLMRKSLGTLNLKLMADTKQHFIIFICLFIYFLLSYLILDMFSSQGCTYLGVYFLRESVPVVIISSNMYKVKHYLIHND